MFWPHLDHRVEQSRIIADMLSSNRDSWLEWTSFRVAYRDSAVSSMLSFAGSQCTKRSVRPVEIMPFGICIKTILDSVEIWWEERHTPPFLEAPEEPFHLRVELPDTGWCSRVFDPSLVHGYEESRLELPAPISNHESGHGVLSDRMINEL